MFRFLKGMIGSFKMLEWIYEKLIAEKNIDQQIDMVPSDRVVLAGSWEFIHNSSYFAYFFAHAVHDFVGRKNMLKEQAKNGLNCMNKNVFAT